LKETDKGREACGLDFDVKVSDTLPVSSLEAKLWDTNDRFGPEWEQLLLHGCEWYLKLT
jgi:hypothetical protein